MASWVTTPAAGPVLEFEALIKVFYAEHGTKDDLLAIIAGVRKWTDDRFESSAGLSRAYLNGEGQFPDRLPWLVLAGQFLEEFVLAVERWTDWAEQIVATWPEDLTHAVPDRPTLEAMATHSDEHLARTKRRAASAPNR